MLTRPSKSQTLLLPLILMTFSSNPPPPEQDFPTDDLPPLAPELILNHTLNKQAKDKLFSLQDHFLLNYDLSSLCFQSLGTIPNILLSTYSPSNHLAYSLKNSIFSYAFSRLLGQRTLGIIFLNSSLGSITPHNGSPFFNKKNPNGLIHTLVGLKPFKASTDNLVMSFPQATFYKTHPYSLYEQPLTNLPELRNMQKTVCLKNNIIPDEL
ncbi:hypothetical protein SADUNF_SadunfUnG0000200 [Salix dunnii]|uniref:Uncharacterized protein n=1 Tax=Salix dunnii TaxID=1413687 RepID=A0A835IZY4_9ROSI|nr:hypothetical protein SADUNF_SadunfUnG0000200 [Salix dunnii]